jgi:hypothetical protein
MIKASLSKERGVNIKMRSYLGSIAFSLILEYTSVQEPG